MQIKEGAMKIFLNAVLILIVFSQTVIADDKSDVRVLLKGKLDAVMTVLQKDDLDSQKKKDKVAEIVEPIFDFPLMSKLALGRTYWSGMTKENKDRFTKLFTKRLKESYLSKIDLYHDEKIIFESPLQVDKKIHIPTSLITKEKKITLLYKLYQSQNSWKIYDIEVQGVSVIRTYRSQFSESLQRGTIEELMTKLETMSSGKIPTPLDSLL